MGRTELFLYNPSIYFSLISSRFTMSKPTLLLVDGSSYLYRAYHAMAQLSAPDGAPTGALYGVLNMLRRLRADYVHDYCAVVFDAKGKNFRHEMFPRLQGDAPADAGRFAPAGGSLARFGAADGLAGAGDSASRSGRRHRHAGGNGR